MEQKPCSMSQTISALNFWEEDPLWVSGIFLWRIYFFGGRAFSVPSRNTCFCLQYCITLVQSALLPKLMAELRYQLMISNSYFYTNEKNRNRHSEHHFHNPEIHGDQRNSAVPYQEKNTIHIPTAQKMLMPNKMS